MDTDQARTFMAVMETRNFVQAAAFLNVTQSTVSARIKALEERMGCRLFHRSKAGVFLTPAGDRFARHAANFVRIWGQAQQEVALPEAFKARINVGTQISHWDDVIVNWMGWLRRTHPELAIRMEVGSNESLMRQMVDGVLDVAVVYTPQLMPGLKVETLFEEQLILVSTQRPKGRGEEARAGWQQIYVFVDWGPDYRTEHALAWPEIESSSIQFGVGAVALDFIMRYGGAGYFPARMVRQLVEDKKLFRIPGARRFTRPVYMVSTEAFSEPPFSDLLGGLRRIAIETQQAVGAQLKSAPEA